MKTIDISKVKPGMIIRTDAGWQSEMTAKVVSAVTIGSLTVLTVATHYVSPSTCNAVAGHEVITSIATSTVRVVDPKNAGLTLT